jgi:hypothetical protein
VQEDCSRAGLVKAISAIPDTATSTKILTGLNLQYLLPDGKGKGTLFLPKDNAYTSLGATSCCCIRAPRAGMLQNYFRASALTQATCMQCVSLKLLHWCAKTTSSNGKPHFLEMYVHAGVPVDSLISTLQNQTVSIFAYHFLFGQVIACEPANESVIFRSIKLYVTNLLDNNERAASVSDFEMMP